MFNMLPIFAQTESGPPVHLIQGVVFHLGPIAITNTMLYGWISIIAITIILSIAARRMTVRPKGGFIQLVEVLAEFIRATVEGAFENKSKAAKYLPFFLSLFLLILLANWLGLLPITREAFVVGETALFKPLTASFNATLAAAVITMGYVYVSSVRELGFKKFFGHFFAGSLKNPLFLIIGILEMVSDLFRVVSLSLRLFLNVAIGEILIAVFAYLGGYLAPAAALPFFLLEIFVLALQAYIFVILGTMYLAIAVNHGEYVEEDSLTKEENTGRMTTEPNRVPSG